MFPGFHNVSQIYRSANTLVYRGLRDDGMPVVLKVPHEVDEASRVAYRHEYQILQRLDFPGAFAVYELLQHERALMLVLEDFGGEPLRYWRRARQLTVRTILGLAVSITEQLGRIHERNIIHRDICPGNIVWNPDTAQIKIVDFGNATVLSQEPTSFDIPAQLRGTLRYIAPEQTGRTSRVVDHRTDFYSLGASLYELLTGVPPFPGDDPMTLIHAHLAKAPPPPHEVHAGVPPVVSAVIMKLLAKAAEERYQSAHGLIADLMRCLDEPGVSFTLGEHDVSPVLRFSHKLYGREREVQAMQARFDEITTGGRGLVVVSGLPGVGKSSLARELYGAVTASHGLFIRSKYEQYQHDVPAGAITRALDSLAAQLLTRDQTALVRWQRRLKGEIGADSQSLFELCPAFVRVLGPTPETAEISPTEISARRKRVFTGLLRSIAHAGEPLVLFLDDLQWADSASLELLEAALTDEELGYFLFVGAYREGDVGHTHPVILTIDSLDARGVPITRLGLRPLDRAGVTALIADTLRQPQAAVEPLAALIHHKTKGNPFFVIEFVRMLERKSLLHFSSSTGAWTWNAESIAVEELTDNVVELLIERIGDFPQAAREALTTASLLGNRFSLRSLAAAMERAPVEVFGALEPAISEGVLLGIGELETSDAGDLFAPLVMAELRFAHDRVQQASYALIPPHERESWHLRVGRMLSERLTGEEHRRAFFDIVGHLNAGRKGIREPEELHRLSRLNRDAGQQAMLTQSAEAAAGYLAVAAECAPADLWDREPAAAAELWLLYAEAELKVKGYQHAELLLREVLRRTCQPLERATAHRLMVRLYTLTARYDQACAQARAGLACIGYELPEITGDTDGEAAVQARYDECRRELARRSLDELVGSRECLDERVRAAQHLLHEVSPAAYYSGMVAFSLFGLLSMRITLDSGVTGLAATGMAAYGLAVRRLGATSGGEAVGRAAIALAERFQAMEQLAVVCNAYGAFLAPWGRALREIDPILERGCHAGILGGTSTMAVVNLNKLLIHRLFYGESLTDLLERVPSYMDFARDAGLPLARDIISAVSLVARALAGRTSGPLAFEDDLYDSADEFLASCTERSSILAATSFSIDVGMTYYLYGQAARAAEILARARLAFASGSILTAKHCFYRALVQAELMREAEPGERRALADELADSQRTLAELAQGCPANFSHMRALVEAEVARASGDKWRALAAYNASIEAAREHRYIHIEALAHELAAGFWLHEGEEDYARAHLSHARHGYEQWGSSRKLEHLEERFGSLATSLYEITPRELAEAMDPVHTVTAHNASIDVMSVVKASQTVAGEIVYERLVETLMRVVIENAGAERGTLLLREEADLTVVAEAAAEASTGLARIPLSGWSGGSQAVVRYVERTGETMILGDATADPRFAGDPRIASYAYLSILCMPLLRQGQIIGVLYLENQLSRDAFSRERVGVLRILAAQIAISLENARYVQEMRQRTFLEGQLLAASDVQRALLPEPLDSDKVDIASHYQPASETGGDWFGYYLDEERDRLYVLICDVTGHGMSSALIASTASGAAKGVLSFMQAVAYNVPPARSLTEIAQAIQAAIAATSRQVGHWMTMALVCIDLGTGAGWSFNAGHCIPLLAGTGGVRGLAAAGTPLGSEPWLGQTPVVSFELAPGESLFLHTDGLLENTGPTGKCIKYRGLCRLLGSGGDADTLKQRILAAAAATWEDHPGMDDVSFVIVRRR